MDSVNTEAKPNDFRIIGNTWGDKKFKLRNKFKQLTDDDLYFMDGKEDELIARLQARLNKSEAEVQQLINSL